MWYTYNKSMKGRGQMAKGQKSRPRSDWAETSRKKQVQWQKENRVKLAADVPKAVGEAFREYCKAKGKSVSAVLSEYVRDVLRSCPGSTDASEDPESIQGEKDC